VSFAAIRDRVALDAVRRAPKGLFSDVVGWGARRRLPRSLRRPLYTAFARVAGADLAEVERPLEEYPSFGAFFARRLADGLRPLPDDPAALVCPCDGRLAAAGTIDGGTLLQVKGRHYSLGELLGDPERAARYDGGGYATIYLSPRDYHRVHSPIGAALTGYDYLPGARFPVMPYFAERVDGLLCRNERVVLHLEGDAGAAEVVMVAAIGVGNLALSRPAVESRRFKRSGGPRRERFAGLPLRAGDELGAFELGSTVVMVFEPDRARLEAPAIGEVLRFGQPLGRLLDGTRGRA
jgi:phosphatidylserine decarboxylase